jgi:hypothetical protein
LNERVVVFVVLVVHDRERVARRLVAVAAAVPGDEGCPADPGQHRAGTRALRDARRRGVAPHGFRVCLASHRSIS